jgi:hypothetical protein
MNQNIVILIHSPCLPQQLNPGICLPQCQTERSTYISNQGPSNKGQNEQLQINMKRKGCRLAKCFDK